MGFSREELPAGSGGSYERMREYASLQRDMRRTELMVVKMESRLSIWNLYRLYAAGG